MRIRFTYLLMQGLLMCSENCVPEGGKYDLEHVAHIVKSEKRTYII
jgi:hypothetical protein